MRPLGGTPTVSALRAWAEMIKFSHSIFALPFALVAAFLAGRNIEAGHPTWLHLVLVVVCMVSARSVAMTFNRIVDVRIDAGNPRTANRALPAGQLTMSQAWRFLGLFFATFAASCFLFYVLLGNPWPMLLGGPLLIFLCGYSFAKRFTQLTHLWLGSAIGLSPVAAWIAIHPASLGWTAVLLSVAVTLWIAGFDIIYACQDIDADRWQGLFSLPARLGPARALILTRVAHAMVVVLLLLIGAMGGLGWLYYVGAVAAAALLLIENLCVSANDFSKVNLAFFTINGLVSLLYGACAIGDILLRLPRLF